MEDKRILKPSKPPKEVKSAERRFTNTNNPGSKTASKPRKGTNRGTSSYSQR